MLHIHADAGQAGRLQIAIDLARRGNGRIACIQTAETAPYAVGFHGEIIWLAAMSDSIRDQDKLDRQAIEARLQDAAVDWDWRCADGTAAEALITHSRLADIVVISQPMANVAHSPLPIVGDVIVHSGAPVLVVPVGISGFPADGAAMLAWNGSAEAAHAMRLAVPLLQNASCVHVVEVGDEEPGTPATDAATYLARHDVRCDVHDWPAKGRRTSAALLHAIAELDVGFVVMGAYGHSRLRETVLGGVTRELVAASPVPLLLAH